ncbi:MAG: arginine decarboxylase, partial [Bacteroidetes bacterium 4572_77]
AVLVDEAHGAHFRFHSELPESAMAVGADMSAVSVHKTGGSLTQSSVLLLNEGLIDKNTVRTTLNLTQTTSASYLLMTSLDIAVGDTEESLKKLVEALKDMSIKHKGNKIKFGKVTLKNPEIIVSPRNAFYARKKLVKLEEAEGEISGESIMAYPPGIPIVTPGEKISKDIINYINFLKNQHSMLTDTEDPYVENIKVLGVL